jgi:hypothetical protein
MDMMFLAKMLCGLQSAVSNEENVDNAEIRGWSDKEVEALIEAWKKHCLKFESPKYTKKRVWEIINEELNGYKIRKSGKRCDEK